MSRQHIAPTEDKPLLRSGGKVTNKKRKEKTSKDQSTLTQLHAVLFPDGRRSTDFIGVSSNDEIYQEPRPKKRRKVSMKSARKDNTLTQRHGFIRSTGSFECGDSDEEVQQLKEQPMESAADRVKSLKERNEIRIAEDIQPTSLVLDEDVDIKAERLAEDTGRPSTSHQLKLEPTNTSHPLAWPSSSMSGRFSTPRKNVRFATEQVIPSSQTPSDAGMSTQRSVRYQELARSPLKEKSRNARIFKIANDKQTSLNTVSKNTASLCETSPAIGRKAKRSVRVPSQLDTLSANIVAEEKENQVDPLEMRVSTLGQSSVQQHQRPYADCDARKWDLESTVRDFNPCSSSHHVAESRLKFENMSPHTHRRLTCSHAQGSANMDTQPAEETPSLTGNSANKTEHREPTMTWRARNRSSLKRVSTIQDSDDEACELDEAEQELEKQDDETMSEEETSEEETFANTTLRNTLTHDPVNSALDRDAARFLRTQRTRPQRREEARTDNQLTLSTLLHNDSNVEDSDDNKDAVLADEHDSTDEDAIAVTPMHPSAVSDEPSRCRNRATDRSGIESQCTLVTSATLLDLVGVPDSQTQTQTQTQIVSGNEILDIQCSSKPAERAKEESTSSNPGSEVHDFASQPAAPHHTIVEAQPSLFAQQADDTKTRSEPQKVSMAFDDAAEVVPSSQPNERCCVVDDEDTLSRTITTRIPSSPPVLRSSQISTVVPTQWSQGRMALAGLRSTSLIRPDPEILALSQTTLSSPDFRPWIFPFSDTASRSMNKGRTTQSHRNDTYEETQPMNTAEFSLAPPPQWQPGMLTMSSSPVDVPPGYSPHTSWKLQQDTEQDCAIKTQSLAMEDLRLPPPPPYTCGETMEPDHSNSR
nr:hypothetical protein CFP56_32281 [Quercus suber]